MLDGQGLGLAPGALGQVTLELGSFDNPGRIGRVRKSKSDTALALGLEKMTCHWISHLYRLKEDQHYRTSSWLPAT